MKVLKNKRSRFRASLGKKVCKKNKIVAFGEIKSTKSYIILVFFQSLFDYNLNLFNTVGC
jgi:hypothetical protein